MQAMSRKYEVLCISGSLRRNSANTAALEAAARLAPPDLRLNIYRGLRDLPPFDPDLDIASLPASVAALRAHVGACDALLLAVPEYAHGVPGAFKNLLDWLVSGTEIPGKPALLINTSARGSHHAQDALIEILNTMSIHLISSTPLVVALPASGCNVDAVLEVSTRRAELLSVLQCLQSALRRDATLS